MSETAYVRLPSVIGVNVGLQPAATEKTEKTNEVDIRDIGVNLAAFASEVFGIAESAKQLACALQAAEIPFVVNDVESGVHTRRAVSLRAYISDNNPYPVNIIHVNAPEAQRFFASRPSHYFENKINVGIWYWELPSLPSKWIPCFKLYDQIWVTSRFIQETLSKVSSVPVQKIPFPLAIDTPISPLARERFGLKENVCVFVFAFDYHSVFERKNPLGVVQAFRRAFDRQDDAVLIINTINTHADPENSRRFRDASRGSRIFILDGYLNRPDYFALLAASDCYVSLHRSEGLGMIMAQAMYLGKPVIATGYSGNLDFMNNHNSLLVPFTLVELHKNYGPYEKGNTWAEPNIDQASQFMRWVYENRDESRGVGERAAQDVRRLMDPKLVGHEIRSKLLKMIADDRRSGALRRS